jgi:hypothetical protein
MDRKLREPRPAAEIEEEARHHRDAALRSTRAAHHHPVERGGSDAI